jgi:hypothetical protein
MLACNYYRFQVPVQRREVLDMSPVVKLGGFAVQPMNYHVLLRG